MITREDLIAAGYKEEMCLIGDMYFKDGFHCRILNDGTVDYRSDKYDMKCLGKPKDFDEIKQIEKQFYIEQKKLKQLEVMMLEEIIKSYET